MFYYREPIQYYRNCSPTPCPSLQGGEKAWYVLHTVREYPISFTPSLEGGGRG